MWKTAEELNHCFGSIMNCAFGSDFDNSSDAIKLEGDAVLISLRRMLVNKKGILNLLHHLEVYNESKAYKYKDVISKQFHKIWAIPCFFAVYAARLTAIEPNEKEFLDQNFQRIFDQCSELSIWLEAQL